MPTNKEMDDARLLIKYFNKKYEESYGENYIGNSHSDVWGFRSMIDDLGFDNAHAVIAYYFRTRPSRGHSREHLLYNYHLYQEAVDAKRSERKHLKGLLDKMKEDFGEG